MPGTTFAAETRDWEGLLAAYMDNADLLVAAEPQKLALEAILSEAKTLKDVQQSHAAVRQESTQRLNELMERGREAARRLRGAVKANLGTKNERLVQFKVKPIRKRGSRKSTAPPAETPPPAPPPAPAPDVA